MGCPIRKSRYQRLFAPKPSLSQLITSFIASESLGIHRSPFFAFLFALNYTSSFALLYAFVTLYNFCEIVYVKKYFWLVKNLLSFVHHFKDRMFSSKKTSSEGYGLEPPAVDHFPTGGFLWSIKGLGLDLRASRCGELLSFETLTLVVPGRVELPTSTLSV